MKPTNCNVATVGLHGKAACNFEIIMDNVNETHYAHTLMPTLAYQYAFAHSWNALLSISLWHLFVPSSGGDIVITALHAQMA